MLWNNDVDLIVAIAVWQSYSILTLHTNLNSPSPDEAGRSPWVTGQPKPHREILLCKSWWDQLYVLGGSAHVQFMQRQFNLLRLRPTKSTEWDPGLHRLTLSWKHKYKTKQITQRVNKIHLYYKTHHLVLACIYKGYWRRKLFLIGWLPYFWVPS